MLTTQGATLPTDIKLGYVPYSPENENICSIAFPTSLDLATLIPNKTVVIVAAPGAFTPTCTENHIPDFVKKADELKAKGADEILVLTTDNPFITVAWGKALGNKGQVKFVSDPKGQFSGKLGLANLAGDDFVPARTLRYALIVKNGVITYIGLEPSKGVTVSGFDAVLENL